MSYYISYFWPTQPLQGTDRRDPVFHGGSFEVHHFTSDAAGLQIIARGVGRTAVSEGGVRLSFSKDEKDVIRQSVQADLTFRGIDTLSEARATWSKARETGESVDTIVAKKAAFEEAREKYQNKGFKVGFRNWETDPKKPGTLRAQAIKVPFLIYNRLASPSASESVRTISEAAGVAMALRTADNRLILQHRAVESVDLTTSKKKPGNASYNDIPGASVAGMIDAAIWSHERQAGAPDTVTTESLTAHISREAGEELGLNEHQIIGTRIVGIAHDNIKPHDEVLFLAETCLSAGEVRRNAIQSSRNKNLAPEDLEEKFLDIPATPEAIFTLLAEVGCPLPPTHAASFVACGFMMVLEQTGSRVEAESWASLLETAVQKNYRAIDERVSRYYENHPEALAIVPERMWGKPLPRNPHGYAPHFTPGEQGLPELEDELVRTGLTPETRTKITAARLFDVDGVLVNPVTKEVSDPAIFREVAECLKRGEAIALNTGRSTSWVEEKIIAGLRTHLDDLALYRNLMVIGEKGGTWTTFDKEGVAVHGQAPDLAIDEALKKNVSDLVSDKYSDSMFFDESKRTMLSIEMHKNYDLVSFTRRQEAFVNDVSTLLSRHSKAGALKIDATTIATDVENPHVGKALGAERFLEFLKSRNIAFADAAFTAYGDSPSDATMADELERRGLRTKFIFVGEPAKLQQSRRYQVVVEPESGIYEKGTISHLQNAPEK